MGLFAGASITAPRKRTCSRALQTVVLTQRIVYLARLTSLTKHKFLRIEVQITQALPLFYGHENHRSDYSCILSQAISILVLIASFL